MKKRIQNLSVMQKLLLSYTVLILGVMIFMGIYILPTQFHTWNQHLEEKISQAASLLSQDTEVRSQTATGSFSSALVQRLDQLLSDSSDIDYIVIADLDSVRLYHPDHARIGQTFTGKDEAGILQGEAPYITTKQGNTKIQKRAFHAIYTTEGKICGFIMVSASLTTIRTQEKKIFLNFLLIFLLILLIGFLFAWILSKSIRNSLFGFEPGAFARMYLQREEILDQLDEGILVADRKGDFLYQNSSAKRIFTTTSCKDYPELFPLMEECRTSAKSLFGKILDINGNSLLASLLPFSTPDQTGNVLLIIRDRTELVRLTDQLTGSNHVVDALRANTHEYMNRLHVISGLLQIGETEEALSFISEVSTDIENGYQTIVRQIQNRTIAALILGKYNRAKELNINFTLRNDSVLEAHNPYLSSKELITVIGNLVENAFEAMKDSASSRSVELFIGSALQGLTITVDDTGKGMTEAQIQQIYKGQYTTKGEGHGFGLRLIQEIIQKHNGYLDIESEPGVGTSFTISLHERRNGYD